MTMRKQYHRAPVLARLVLVATLALTLAGLVGTTTAQTGTVITVVYESFDSTNIQAFQLNGDAALAGDPLAIQVVEEAALYLGIVIAGVLNLMNPAMVILGGGLSRLDELLLNPLRETVLRRTLVTSIAASEIRTSDLGPRCIAIGAATYVLQNALEDPSLFPGVKE